MEWPNHSRCCRNVFRVPHGQLVVLCPTRRLGTHFPPIHYTKARYKRKDGRVGGCGYREAPRCRSRRSETNDNRDIWREGYPLAVGWIWSSQFIVYESGIVGCSAQLCIRCRCSEAPAAPTPLDVGGCKLSYESPPWPTPLTRSLSKRALRATSSIMSFLHDLDARRPWASHGLPDTELGQTWWCNDHGLTCECAKVFGAIRTHLCIVGRDSTTQTRKVSGKG